MYYYKISDGENFRLLSSSSPLSMGTEITEEEFNKAVPSELNEMEEEIFVLKDKKIEEMEII